MTNASKSRRDEIDLLRRHNGLLRGSIDHIATILGLPQVKRCSELRAKISAEVAFAQSLRLPEDV